MPRRLLATALAALALAACSTSQPDTAAPSSSNTTAPLEAATTSFAATRQADTTILRSAGSAATSVPVPPSPVDLNADEVVYELDRATDALWDFLDACLANPSTCDANQLPVAPASPAFSSLAGYIDQLRVEQHYVSAPLDPRSRTWILLSTDGARATVRMCVVDRSVVMDSLGTPDTADDVVVDDAVTSVTQDRTYVKSASSSWLLEEALNTTQAPGDTCSA